MKETVLWRCRIPLLSLFAGLFLFGSVAQVQDLFLERLSIWAILAFIVLVVLLWAVPVERASRRALQALRSDTNSDPPTVDAWLPMLLGLSTFTIVGLGLIVAARRLAGIGSLPEAIDGISQLKGIGLALIVAGALYCIAFAPATSSWRARLVERWPILQHPWAKKLPTGYAILVVLALAAALFWPLQFTDTVGRAALLPILLGGWLPVLNWLAVRSDKAGWPILLGSLAALLGILTFLPQIHDVRTFHSSHWIAAQKDQTEATARQALLSDAVDKWLKLNRCSGKDCPRIVLVAGEGGASRSAFMTASVLGGLIDITRANPQRYHDPGSTIFAMSGVSGGAVGFTITRAALMDTQPGGDPPCRKDHVLAFGSGKQRDLATSWRACLQAVAAGDFLSPTMAGLVFRDNLPIPNTIEDGIGFVDRAALMEKAMERHYSDIVFGKKSTCSANDTNGLCRPIGYLHQTDRWLPLLFLNATSVETGRQVIVSDIASAYARNDRNLDETVPYTYNVFELLGAREFENPSDEAPTTIGNLQEAPDLRLSTAAVLSARFPLISPEGNIRRAKGDLITRVVDGGYFDNSGLATLAELIPHLTARNLRPTVILITNDAWDYQPGLEDQPNHERFWHLPGRFWTKAFNRTEKLPSGFWSQLYAALFHPLETLDKARSGHRERAEDALRKQLAALGEDGQFRKVRLSQRPVIQLLPNAWCPEPPAGERRLVGSEIAMNWWLSPVLQAFLDAQLCSAQNDRALEQILTSFEIDQPHPAKPNSP